MKTNALGLVPGKAVANFDVYRAGQECGFDPGVAARLVAKGLWKPTDPENATATAASNSAKAVEDAADEGEVLLVGLETGTLTIPKNWREAHHAKRKSWAKSIKPDAEDIDADAANEIIAEAVKDQEDPAGK